MPNNSINASKEQETTIIKDLTTGKGCVWGIIEDGCVTVRDFQPNNAHDSGINPQDSTETRVSNAS